MPTFYRLADSPHMSKARIFPEVRILKTGDFTPLTSKNLRLINNEHLRYIIEKYPSRVEIRKEAYLPKLALYKSLNMINDRTLARFLGETKDCTFRGALFVLKNFLSQEPAGSLMITPGIKTKNNEAHPGDKLCLFMARMMETAGSKEKKPFMSPISVELPSLFFFEEFRQALTIMLMPKLLSTASGARTEKRMLMLPISFG